MSAKLPNLNAAIGVSIATLKQAGQEVDTGHWQGVATGGKPDLVTLEVLDMDFACPMVDPKVHEYELRELIPLWRHQVQPNLPWADDHFEERVSRVPSNPGEEYKNWPWWHGQDLETMEGRKFTHTYQERFWPKRAGDVDTDELDWGSGHVGIRYSYGDLDDVVNLLLREPYTRQAYFPIYFPEDTGSVHTGRTPCTLGYHFMLRGEELHMWYTIRSCDAVRHFRDDVYLALRLLLWVIEALQTKAHYMKDRPEYFWDSVRPGRFHFKAFSFHVHKGDLHLL